MAQAFNKEQFQQTLTTLRKSRGLTQAKLSEALGISDKTYSKWETGENEPDMASLHRLAQYYEISPAVFFGNEDRGRAEEFVEAQFHGLSTEDTVKKAFELQFHAIRGLAKHAIGDTRAYGALSSVTPPENLVNLKNEHAITAYAAPGIFQMMYQGTDANISLSLMPHEEAYQWLIDERASLAAYLALIADGDMLRCLPYMISGSMTERYTAAHLSELTGVDKSKTEALLHTAVEHGICSMTEAHIGRKKVELFRTEADHMLLGILTLAHLSLPTAERCGHYYFGIPMRQIKVGKENGHELR